MTRVAGLDLSLTSTGVALVGDGEPAELHRVRSAGHRGDSLWERFLRLDRLRREIVDLVHGDSPDLVVVEGPSFGSAGAGTFDRSGLWWLVVWELSAAIPVAEVSPSARAKYATGAGGGPKAAKDAVLAAVVRRYSDVEVDGNDVADALLLAAMGARHLDAPIDEVPAVNLQAMEKVAWPDPSESS